MSVLSFLDIQALIGLKPGDFYTFLFFSNPAAQGPNSFAVNRTQLLFPQDTSPGPQTMWHSISDTKLLSTEALAF